MVQETSSNEKILGIDLGTSNSVVAILLGGKPTVIPPVEGLNQYGKVIPSYVAFTENGEKKVGQIAKQQATLYPENTISNIKRKMGTNFKIKIKDKEYIPQEISAFILQKIKKDAEDYLDEKIEKAVITVPAYFNDNQRTATKDAGAIAGLDVVRLVNEPTAASLAYGFNKTTDKDNKIMVYDFGGGTLDVTISSLNDGVFDVKSTSGDTQLGGTDIDNIILNYISDNFEKKNNIDLRKDDQARERLREASENAKIELSNMLESKIILPFIAKDKSLEYNLTRTKLEDLINQLVKRSEISMKQALNDANLKPTDIDKLILIGGTTRIPFVQNFVENYIGKTAEKGIDPMEAVAIGAAIQGGVLAGEVKNQGLLDVIPLSLGIETLGNVFTKLIYKNTRIPIRTSQIFSTVSDNQKSVEIHVLQGEQSMASDNTTLGRFELVGIPITPRGLPKIEVNFNIDENGIINVSAKDMETGRRQAITITDSNRLSDGEINQIVKETEMHTNSSDYKIYKNNIHDLIMVYQNKGDIARKIIKEHFPPPQMTYNRFMNEIDKLNIIFKKQSKLALDIIDIGSEFTKKIEDKLTEMVNSLKSIVKKMENFTDELIINLGHASDSEVENVLEEMQMVIDSVKEYN
jgi:molecular chaperone DnaK